MINAKHKELKLRIEQEIRTSVFKDKLPGVHRLAERYGMNHITVTKALKALERDGIIAIEGTRGTRIVGPSRRVHRRIALVGLMYIESREFPYLRELETVCKSSDYEASNVRFTSPGSFLHASSMLAALEVDGIIFSYCRPDRKMNDALSQAGIRSVQLARSNASYVPWMDADNERGLAAAFTHLTENGHKRIMFCSPQHGNEESRRLTEEAYRTAMRSIGTYDPLLYFSPDTVDAYIERHGEGYRRVFGAECAAHLLSLAERPSAVYVHARETAYAMMDVLARNGLSVPDDISVIAATDDESESAGEALLTLLEHPRMALIRNAAASLIRAMNENGCVENVLLERRLILNRSVKKIV
ncbi:MAG: substrate-binding domain-containing protein [Spirochaetota bacterium]